MMAISQASALVGDLRSLKMCDNKTNVRINPMDGKRCISSQSKIHNELFPEKVDRVNRKVATELRKLCCFFDFNFFR